MNKDQYIETSYEEFAHKPASFLDNLVRQLGASSNYNKQTDNKFYIDPSKSHLVAGNPMRYKGRQKIKYDDSWKTRLTPNEIKIINQLK